jgi:hypothetical protein
MRLPASVEIGNRITATEAAARFEVYVKALCSAIEAGSVRGEVIQVGSRCIRLVDPEELAEDLRRLPRCGYVDKRTGELCERPAVQPGSQACSGPHARALETKGTTLSAETRDRMSEAQTARHRRADELLARLNAAGYLNLSQVAAERHVAPNTVSRWVEEGFLAAEHHIALRPLLLVSRDELARFNAEEWPRIVQHVGSRRLPHWTPRSGQRWAGRANGSKGAVAGIEAGRAKGGRPPKATPEEQQEMLSFDREGLSSRQIAAAVFGDARLYKRVQRFLNR